MLKTRMSVINYFGNSSDGDLSTVGNVNLASVLDGAAFIANYKNLTINTGHKLTVTNRCKGLFLYNSGDCVINGEMSMTARGVAAAGQDMNFSKLSNTASNWLQESFLRSIGILLPANGASGGIGGTGNGNGGGDFYGQDGDNVIGTWARDIVSVSNKMPEGYKELKFNLKEK